MWQAIISILFGQIPGIVREIQQAKVQLANTQGEIEKARIQERIHALQDRKEALLGMNKYYFILVLLVLAPFIPYLWWIIGWDKIACKWFTDPDLVDKICSTDPLGPWLEAMLASILSLIVLKKA